MAGGGAQHGGERLVQPGHGEVAGLVWTCVDDDFKLLGLVVLHSGFGGGEIQSVA